MPERKPLSKKKELQPHGGYPGLPIDDNPPDISAANYYYKHRILPRRVKDDEEGRYRKVEFGVDSEGSELYPILTTMPGDLNEFGLGVAMYFETLYLLAIAFFFCGIFASQSISYYRSPEYSDGQEGVPFLLRGSAICTRRETVCLDTECNEMRERNLCQIGTTQAYFDITMIVVLLVLGGIIAMRQNTESARLDESIQTAQDYSVMVDDPGPGDFDPVEWRDFFQQFGHVTFVTVAKDNGPLIKALSERRAIMREIIMVMGNGEASDEADDDGVLDTTWDGKSFSDKLEALAAQESGGGGGVQHKARRAVFSMLGMKPVDQLKAALEGVNGKLRGILEAAAATPFKASKVFVTFETELAQRRCLKALSQGTLVAALDWGKGRIAAEHLWKGGNVLCVKEAPEPNEVFWEDVDVDFRKRVTQQATTMVATGVLVLGSVVACKALQLSLGTTGAALWISVTNTLIPSVLRTLSTVVEDHVSLNDQQLSLYHKLTFFRWMNTAVVIYLITNLESFLTEAAMKQVQAVILADAVTSPLLRTLNPSVVVTRRVVSRYAATQEKMNSYFLGTAWYPAERYADMTKTLFLALFYSALLPAGLFLTCLGYAFAFFMDKYSLLRAWATPAELDDGITKVSRNHIAFAVYMHVVMTMVFYAEFPFDGICRVHGGGGDAGGEEDAAAAAAAAVVSGGRFAEVQASHGVVSDEVFARCDMGVSGHVLGAVFGLLGAERGGGAGSGMVRADMPDEQRRAVLAFAGLAALLSVLLFVALFGASTLRFVYRLFYGSYAADTEATRHKFSDCDIQAYIPNIRHRALAYPLICADVEQFDAKYLNFTLEAEALYAVQSLVGAHELPGYSPEDLGRLFSEVAHFEPPEGLTEDEWEAEDKAQPQPPSAAASTRRGGGGGWFGRVARRAGKGGRTEGNEDYEPVAEEDAEEGGAKERDAEE